MAETRRQDWRLHQTISGPAGRVSVQMMASPLSEIFANSPWQKKRIIKKHVTFMTLMCSSPCVVGWVLQKLLQHLTSIHLFFSKSELWGLYFLHFGELSHQMSLNSSVCLQYFGNIVLITEKWKLHQYQTHTPNWGRPPLFPSSFSITETMTVIRVWLCRFICVCVLPESSGSHYYVLLFTINCMLAELLYSQCQTFSFHLLQWIPSFCSWCHSWDCSTCFSLPARAPLWIIGVCGLYNYSSGLPKCESGTQSGFRLIKAPWTHTMILFVVKWLLSSLQLLHLSVIAI